MASTENIENAVKDFQGKAMLSNLHTHTTFCDGKNTAEEMVVAALEKASGKKVNYKIVDRRPGDIATCYASTDKAKKYLGWEAKYDIARMCEDSWRFVDKNR